MIFSIHHLVHRIIYSTVFVTPELEFKSILYNWHSKGRGMYYSVHGMVHIKEPLLLVGKSNPCDSGFLY